MPDPAAIARLMGASPAQAAAAPAVNIASRFALAGVVARPSGTGVALISVDGKPAKPYRVGAPVEEGLVLQAVEPRRALLGPSAQGPASVTLELPVPKHDVRVEVPARAAPRVPAVPPQFQQPRLPVPLQRPGVMPQNQRPGMPSAAPR
jgi:general secretion pathway protein C